MWGVWLVWYSREMEEIGIESDSLAAILAGTKTIEGRLAKPRFVSLRVGDEISIREDLYENNEIVGSRAQVAIIVITSTRRFKSFRAMLGALGFENFRPDDESIEQALETYHRYYSASDEKKYGVIALSFRLKK